nr:NAD-binding protein [uncultured Methanoregula sp.]
MTKNHNKSFWTWFIIWYRNHLYPFFAEYQYLLLFVVFMGVFTLGYLGLTTLYPQESCLNVAFLTMQLFVMNSGVYQGPPIWTLNIARVAAPIILYTSIITLVAQRFFYHLELLKIRIFTRNHIVVCGLGYVGSIVIRNLIKTQAVPIVVIEKNPNHEEVAWCRRHGVTVIIGDAADKKSLNDARISVAHSLWIATGSDEVNAKVIAEAFEIVKGRRLPLDCHVHIIDPKFSNLLRITEGAHINSLGMNLEFLNIYQIASFWYAEKLPELLLLSVDPADVHILVVGIGRMGENLIFELAKRTQQQCFGNKPRQRIRISIIDRDAAGKKAMLEKQYARIADHCEIIPHTLELFSPDFYKEKFLEGIDAAHPFSTVFIVTADESLNFSTGLYLNQKMNTYITPIIIRTAHDEGFARFFNEIAAKNIGNYQNLRVFPLVSYSSFVDSREDMIELVARTLHRNYIINQFNNEGILPGSKSSLKPWDELTDDFKDSNRSQAANIKHAVGSVGYSIISRASWDEPLTVFSDEDVEQMAINEHDRWWAERRMNGWTYGPNKDVDKKVSPFMVSWDTLPKNVKDSDRNFVQSYPRILAMIDLTLKKRDYPI